MGLKLVKTQMMVFFTAKNILTVIRQVTVIEINIKQTKNDQQSI